MVEAVWASGRETVLPNPATWLSDTKVTTLGLERTRSAALQTVDRNLADFIQSPTAPRLTALRQNLNAWLQSKTKGGQVKSIREPHATNLQARVQALYDRTSDMPRLMGAIETELDTLDWREDVLCAECYGNQGGQAQAAWQAVNLDPMPLEREAIMMSKWADVVPRDIDGWAERGEEEKARLEAWPTLIGPKRMMLGPWPPWAVPFVRKGLFCHSLAALAVKIITDKRAQVEGGGACRIRSIDVFHQKAKGALITHWWVCINRPQQLVLPSGRTIRFDTDADLAWLPMTCGFVVDLWGALWLDQQDTFTTKSVSNAATADDAVADEPLINIGGGGPETLTLYAREEYY